MVRNSSLVVLFRGELESNIGTKSTIIPEHCNCIGGAFHNGMRFLAIE